MILVWLLLAGVIVGFIAAIFIFDYFKAEEKTTMQLIKCCMSVIVLCVIALYLWMQDYSHVLSYVVGVGVGIAPYFTSETKKEDNEEQ